MACTTNQANLPQKLQSGGFVDFVVEQLLEHTKYAQDYVSNLQIRYSERNAERAAKELELIEDLVVSLSETNKAFKEKDFHRQLCEREFENGVLQIKNESLSERRRLLKDLEIYRKGYILAEQERSRLSLYIDNFSARVEVMVRIRCGDKAEEETCKMLFSKENGHRTSKKSRALEFRPVSKKKTTQAPKQVYRFDQVFGGDECQAEVFEAAAKRGVGAALEGRRVAVFAYGETASGKTYTMFGNKKSMTLGIIQLSLLNLMEQIKELGESGYNFQLEFLALEVYQGEFRNLLEEESPDIKGSPTLPIGTIGVVQNSKTSRGYMGRMEFKPCPVAKFSSYSEALELLDLAMNNRSEKRSHCFVQFRIRKCLSLEETLGSLTFVDLAGSERLDPTSPSAARGDDETKQINLSLCHLGHALSQIRQLGCAGEAPDTEPPPGIFRCCRLSWALRDCLGCQADSRSVLLAHVASSPQRCMSTRNTLVFADSLAKGRFSKHPLDAFGSI